MSDDEGERDFLAEARQASELAKAMAEISSLTASATASLASLNRGTASQYYEAPMEPLKSPFKPFASSLSPQATLHDEEYPDMSRYYSGSDYAASLPNPKSSRPSSGLGGLFSRFSSNHEHGLSENGKPLQSERGSTVFVKRLYVGLVCAHMFRHFWPFFGFVRGRVRSFRRF
jgi:hypothetical protein